MSLQTARLGGMAAEARPRVALRRRRASEFHNPMLTAIATTMLLPKQAHDRLSRLATERMTFEHKVVHSKEHELDENIYSMGPGSQHIFGFYPFGKSDRRYLIAMYDGAARTLLYQAISKGKPRTIWILNLRQTKKTAPIHGTLASLLRRVYHVEPSDRASRGERQALAETKPLAAYGYDGNQNAYTWTVRSDGREGPTYRLPSFDSSSNYYPILKEEAKALGLGNRPWPQDLRYDVLPPGG